MKIRLNAAGSRFIAALMLGLTAWGVSCASDSMEDGASGAATNDGNAGPTGNGMGGGGGGSGSAGEGGEAGEASGDWACTSGYELESYSGSQDDLCPPRESVAARPTLDCCLGDIPASDYAICEPNDGPCFIGSFCTDYFSEEWNTEGECGWVVCELDTGEGGAGSPLNDGCQPDKIAEALEDRGDTGATELLCATDAHCPTDEFCTRRLGNRMFCERRSE